MEESGLHQATTYSLTTPEKAAQFAFFESNGKKPVHLAMPMSEDRSALRLSIIPQLLEVVQHHINRQMSDVSLYEMGAVFLSGEEQLTELPVEKEKLSGVLAGHRQTAGWHGNREKIDFFTVKGLLEGLFEILGVEEAVDYRKVNYDGMHPGRTAEVLLGGEVIGLLGQVHPQTQNEWEVNETYVFEIDMEKLLAYEVTPLTYQSLPRFPAITRDIALVVDDHVPAGEVSSIIRQHASALLKNVQLFDVYQGEHLEEGKKSLAFSLTYLDPERTLTDDEVQSVHDNILEALKEEAGAVLRS